MTQKPSVLIIDDDSDIRTTICDNLSERGFNVMQAEDGQKGLSCIRSKKPPTIVITDILMPGEEGLGVIREIKKMKSGIKVIAISGSFMAAGGGSSFLDMARKLGADAVFPKPVDLDELEETIESFIK